VISIKLFFLNALSGKTQTWCVLKVFLFLRMKLGGIFLSIILLLSCTTKEPELYQSIQPYQALSDTLGHKSTCINCSLPQWFTNRGLKGKASWNENSGTLRIFSSVDWGGDDAVETFYFEPPTEVKTIIIGTNVTVTGGFRLKSGITIKGEDRNTSVIFGTNTVTWATGANKVNDSPNCNVTSGDDRASDCRKWQYSAISAIYLPAGDTVKVSSLTILNARTYNITSIYYPIQVDNVTLKERRTKMGISNCDGFGAGHGSSISNSLIDVSDDALKLYRNMTVKNVTIIAQRNGAPFQLGWSSEPTCTISLENVLVYGTDPQQQYNTGLFSWKSTTTNSTRNITINGLKTVNFQNSYIWDYTSSRWVARPLFEVRSSGARLNILAINVSIHSSTHTFPTNTREGISISICENSQLNNIFICGNGDEVTGND
jgi:hypothetical protein